MVREIRENEIEKYVMGASRMIFHSGRSFKLCPL